ncbi:MAG: DUF2321 domain-containing protein [Leadbetterella sp.]|nr:DUF2321 domain-containing protein [Leadbetterella sp.]
MPYSRDYDTMQVCLNGHYITDHYHTSPQFRKQFCTKCGAETTISCPNCKAEIKGDYLNSNVIFLGHSTPVPNICEYCGKDFPWKVKKEEEKISKPLSKKTTQSPFKIDSKKKEKWIRDVASAQIKTVLDELLKEPSIQKDEKNQTAVVNLSSRWHIIEESKHRDTVDFDKLFIQTNKINEALIALIRKL